MEYWEFLYYFNLTFCGYIILSLAWRKVFDLYYKYKDKLAEKTED